MYYCCVTDVVTRRLPAQKDVRFPEARKRLLKLAADDQRERVSTDFYSTDKEVAVEITKRERMRIDEVLSILRVIKTPSTRNVGLDGSRAIWLITLHNYDYKNSGRLVVSKMKNLFYKDKKQVFYPGIPFLVDRLMVGSRKPIDLNDLPYQLYGTQGISFLLSSGQPQSRPFPILNRKNLTKRRQKFGLAPKSSCIHHP